MMRGRPVATTFPVIPSPSAYFAAIDLFRRQPDCRLRAQPAGGFVEQHERPAVHIQLVRNDLHHFPERFAELERGGKDRTDFGQNGQFLISLRRCLLRR